MTLNRCHSPKLFTNVVGVSNLVLTSHNIHEAERVLPLDHEYLGNKIGCACGGLSVLAEFIDLWPHRIPTNPAKNQYSVTGDGVSTLTKTMSG